MLIADRDGFPAAYLGHTLRLIGCRVIGPFESPAALQDWFAAAPEQLSAAVVALDWLNGSDEVVLAGFRARKIPYLLVNNAPWHHLSALQASFSWPYGSFQILEALQSATLQALASREGPNA